MRLVRFNRLRVSIREMSVPTLLLPPVGGDYRLLVDPSVHWSTRQGYILRHELGHVLAGDADEPTVLHFEYPLPESEMVADLFAFMDLIDEADLEQGADWIEMKIRELVVLDYEPWYRRVPRVAEGLVRMERLKKEWLV